MKYLLTAILILAAVSPAAAQSKGKDYRALVEITSVEDVQIATSIRAAEIKEKRGYSAGAEVASVFWVEARKKDGPTKVFMVGERQRYILPHEAPKTKKTEYGPWDPSEPAYVGSPWTDADLRYHGSRIECISDQHWCWQVWYLQVAIPDSVVRSVVSNLKKKEIPVALFSRRRVDWRIPRDELVATLDALGALNEFSEAPTR